MSGDILRGLGGLALVGLLAFASPARGAGPKSPDTDTDAAPPPNYPRTTLEGPFSATTGIPEWLGPAKIGLDFEIELNQNAWNGQAGVYRSFGTHWEAALMIGFITRTYINMVADFRFY